MYISSCLCLFLCFSLCASLALFLSVFVSAFVWLSTQNYLSLCGCKFLFLTAYISCIFTYNHMFTWSFLWGQGSWNARTFFILWEIFFTWHTSVVFPRPFGQERHGFTLFNTFFNISTYFLKLSYQHLFLKWTVQTKHFF